MKKTIGIGIIGTGFISNSFAICFNSVPKVMDLEGELGMGTKLVAISSNTKQRAEDFATRYQIEHAFDDWRDLVSHPDVDAVAIGSADHEHYPQAMAALENNKHILCEKPIAMNTEECINLCDFAKENKLANAVGFTYLANPAVHLMKDLIDSGELGEIYGFRGHYSEDYFSDPALAYNWRCDSSLAYCGAGADLGYHLAGLLVFLFGLPTKIAASRKINIKQRLDEKNNKMREVSTDDIANAVLKYKNGISGTFQATRTATGRKLYQCLEVHGSRGALLMDLEDLNQLLVHLPHKNKQVEGYTRVLIGPEHKFYKYFCPAPGHGLSFNDFVTIQVGEFLRSIVDKNAKPIADLVLGLKVQRIISSMIDASDRKEWIDIETS